MINQLIIDFVGSETLLEDGGTRVVLFPESLASIARSIALAKSLADSGGVAMPVAVVSSSSLCLTRQCRNLEQAMGHIFENPVRQSCGRDGPAIKMDIKRAFDLAVAATAAILLSVPMVIIALLVKRRPTALPPVLVRARRPKQRAVLDAKFRTMRTRAPLVATHLLTDAASNLTSIGSFLRKSSLDELPQLWSILRAI